MRDFLLFRKMLTPLIIHFIFWAGVVLCIISAVTVIWQQGRWLSGLETLLLGPVIVRVVCELLILLFRINESLTEIKHNTTTKIDKEFL